MTDRVGLDVSNSFMDNWFNMDNWGRDNWLRMVISYTAIITLIITRIEMLIDRGINPSVTPAFLLDSVIQVRITLEIACLDLLVGLFDFLGLSLVSQNTAALYT